MANFVVLTCERAHALGLDPYLNHADPECVVIAAEEDDGRISSVSHGPASTDPAERVNESYPYEDLRDVEDDLTADHDDAGALVIRRPAT